MDTQLIDIPISSDEEEEPELDSPAAFLVMVDDGKGENTQQVLNLKAAQVVIGRGGEDSVDVRVDHHSVSTKHATIEPFESVWTIKDGVVNGKKSSNGTFINGKKIKSGILTELDEVRFGKVVFIFQIGSLKLPAVRKVVAKDEVALKVKNEKKMNQFKHAFCSSDEEDDDETELNLKIPSKASSSSSSSSVSSSPSAHSTTVKTTLVESIKPAETTILHKSLVMDADSGSETELEEDDMGGGEEENEKDDVAPDMKETLKESDSPLDTVVDTNSGEQKDNDPPPSHPPKTTRNPSVQFADTTEEILEAVVVAEEEKPTQLENVTAVTSNITDEATQGYDLVSSDSDSDGNDVCVGAAKKKVVQRNNFEEEATQAYSVPLDEEDLSTKIDEEATQAYGMNQDAEIEETEEDDDDGDKDNVGMGHEEATQAYSLPEAPTQAYGMAPEDMTTQALQDMTTQALQDMTTQALQDVTTQALQDMTTQALQDMTTQALQDMTTQALQDVTTQAYEVRVEEEEEEEDDGAEEPTQAYYIPQTEEVSEDEGPVHEMETQAMMPEIEEEEEEDEEEGSVNKTILEVEETIIEDGNSTALESDGETTNGTPLKATGSKTTTPVLTTSSASSSSSSSSSPSATVKLAQDLLSARESPISQAMSTMSSPPTVEKKQLLDRSGGQEREDQKDNERNEEEPEAVVASPVKPSARSKRGRAASPKADKEEVAEKEEEPEAVVASPVKPSARSKRGRAASPKADKEEAAEIEEEQAEDVVNDTQVQKETNEESKQQKQKASSKKRPKREAVISAASAGNSQEDTSTQLKSNTKSPKILFTGVEANAAAKKYVTSIGGTICEDMKKATHLIAAHLDNKLGLKRSSKIMQAISLCLPILDLKWLIESSKAGYPLDEAAYIVQDKTAENRYGFSMTDSLTNTDKVLDGYTVYVAPVPKGAKVPPLSELKLIVEFAGGKFATSPTQVKGKKGSFKLLVLACAECVSDKQVMVETRELAKQSSVIGTVLSPPVLFDAVMKKTLVLEGYELESATSSSTSKKKKR